MTDQSTSNPTRWQVGDLFVDSGTRQVFRDGEELSVPGRSFDLLTALLRAAPNVVSADELMDTVWSGQVVSPETVSQRVKLLRQALNDDPRNPRYVALVRRHGWRCVAPVEVVTPQAADRSRVRRSWITPLAAGLTAMAVLIWLALSLQPALAPQPDPSIAVLPFDNRSDDPQDVWLTEGLHDEVLLELSRIPGLRVISRTSVLPYRYRELSVPDIASELDVGLVLEGAVQRIGNDLRLTLQLIDGMDDRHLWAGRFDQVVNADNLLEIQRRISQAVVDQLEIELLPPRREHTPLATEDGAAAYEAYLQGWQQLDMDAPQNIDQAIRHFEQALEKDPDFARAWVGLAEARLRQWRFRFLHPDVAARLANDAIVRALTLEPDLPEAIAARAEYLWLAGDWQAAETEFRRAIRLKPNLARAYINYGFMLLQNLNDHRPTEAKELWRAAARLDPHSAMLRQHLAWTEFRLGNLAQAERMLREVLNENPDYPTAWFVLGELLAGTGDQAGAVMAYQQALEGNPHIMLANYGLVEALIDLEMDDEAWTALEIARAVPSAPELALRLEFKLLVQTGEARPDLEHARRLIEELIEKEAERASPFYEITAFHEATLELLEGRPENALEVMESFEPRLAEEPGALPRDGFWRPLFCTQAHALVATGEVERGRILARWFLKQLELTPDAARRQHVEPIVCNAVLGEADAALHILHQAAEHGIPAGWRFLTSRPELKSLRADPRFAEIIATIRAEAARQRDRLELGQNTLLSSG